EYRLKVLVFDDRGHGRLAGGFQAVGGDGDHRLANELHLAVCQQRVAGHDGTDVQLAGYVLGGDGNGHAGNLVARRGIDADDTGMGAVAHTGVNVQLVGKFQTVVDVDRF